MTLQDDNDTSAGRMTQGGSRDAGSEGPARRSGNSFMWFAVALLIVAVVAVAWLTRAGRENAPAERNTVPVTDTLTSLGGGSGAARTPAGSPATAPVR